MTRQARHLHRLFPFFDRRRGHLRLASFAVKPHHGPAVLPHRRDAADAFVFQSQRLIVLGYFATT
jgi:hypothetical protein